jgi:hypothetical protein
MVDGIVSVDVLLLRRWDRRIALVVLVVFHFAAGSFHHFVVIVILRNGDHQFTSRFCSDITSPTFLSETRGPCLLTPKSICMSALIHCIYEFATATNFATASRDIMHDAPALSFGPGSELRNRLHHRSKGAHKNTLYQDPSTARSTAEFAAKDPAALSTTAGRQCKAM